MLPGDGHVHTEWSWDAPIGSMAGACARAAELDLPFVAFTDHADYVSWDLTPDLAAYLRDLGVPADGGLFTAPELSLAGYLRCLSQCREQFPAVRILSGVELGEPHLHPQQAASLLRRGRFDRVVVSLHSVPDRAGRYAEISDAYRRDPAADVVCAYLAEAGRMIEAWPDFDVLGHLDYALRYWPPETPAASTGDFEKEFRAVLTRLARRGAALEVNTRLPADPLILTWWREAGGQRLSFGSDVHDPHFLAQGFADAAEVAAACGFAPQPGAGEFWLAQ
jgi:histidinol-phosphatase (PHP family)